MGYLSRSLFLLLALVLLGGCARLLTPGYSSQWSDWQSGAFALDKDHARLLFKIDHLGLSTYVGRFNEFDVQMDFDPDNLASARLIARVQMDSIDLNDAGLEKMLREDWFEVTDYPYAEYRSQSFERIADNRLKVTGELTFRGVTRPVSVQIDLHGGADNWLTGSYTLGFTAQSRFNRADFGMGQYSGVVGDTVELEVYGEMQQQPSGEKQ